MTWRDPTPDEIARVDTYRKHQRQQQEAERRQQRLDADAQAKTKIETALTDRTITRAEAHVSWGDLDSLTLHIDDDSTLHINPDGASTDIDIEHTTRVDDAANYCQQTPPPPAGGTFLYQDTPVKDL